MNEFKGTPGPWAVVGTCCDGVGADFDSGGHKSVCQRPARTGGKLTDEYNANMHLIAAAPELLEALQRMLRAGQKQNWNERYEYEMSLAREAIAKALGESQ